MLSITIKADVALGYGGFSISIDPFFSPIILTFLQRYGAILAVPNIRGGAEFGEEWHKAGTREQKVGCDRLRCIFVTYKTYDRAMSLMISLLQRMLAFCFFIRSLEHA